MLNDLSLKHFRDQIASKLYFPNSSCSLPFLRDVFFSSPSLPFPVFPSPVSISPVLLFIHLFQTYGLLHHARPYVRVQDSSVNKTDKGLVLV